METFRDRQEDNGEKKKEKRKENGRRIITVMVTHLLLKPSMALKHKTVENKCFQFFILIFELATPITFGNEHERQKRYERKRKNERNNTKE